MTITHFRFCLARSWGRAAMRLARTGLVPGVAVQSLPAEEAARWAANYARDAAHQARLVLAVGALQDEIGELEAEAAIERGVPGAGWLAARAEELREELDALLAARAEDGRDGTVIARTVVLAARPAGGAA